ncbi:MAG: hypothetical protein FOGNACKC_02315 [Anaerolineae bacterium]|nr:hypothetical protein [Anaerolineae bacterium]
MTQDLCRYLFEKSNTAMAVLTAGQFSQVTPGLAQLLGCSPAELAGKRLLDVLPDTQPDGSSTAQLLESKFKAAALGRPQNFELLCRRFDGGPVEVAANLDAVSFEDQTYFQLVLHDISQYKMAENALRESESRLRAFVNALPDLAFIYDAEGRYLEVLVSETNTRYTGAAGQFKGKNIRDVIAPGLAEQFLDVIHRALNTQLPQVLEYSLRPEVWYEGRVLPLRSQSQASDRVVWLVRDITHRKKLQQRVQESLDLREQQIRLSTLVSQDAVNVSNLDDFYQQVITHINEQFQVYYSQLLRFNPDNQSLVLAAGYGDVGDQLMAAGYQVESGQGLLGLAAGASATILRPNVSADPLYQPHPLLPETKSELVVPILSGNENAETQHRALQTFIRAGFDGYIVHSFDPETVAKFSHNARQQGQHVIAVGNDLGAQNQTATIPTREQEMGHILGLQAGEWAAAHIRPGQPLKIGLLTYSQVSPRVLEREQAILDGVKDIFGGNFVVIEETAGDPVRGRSVAQAWLKQYPDLNMILGFNDGSALGAYQAVIAAGRNQADKFFVGGIDAVPDAIAAIKAGGAYQASVTQPAEEIGLLAVRTIVAAIKGLPYEPVLNIEYLPVNPANIDEVLARSQQFSATYLAGDVFAGLDLSDITIGLSMLNLSNPYFARLVGAAQAEALRLGVQVVVSESRQVLGVLDVQSREIGRFTADDQQILEGLSRQIAAAIENVQLYQDANIFRQFAESAGQGLGMATLNGQTVYMNPALLRMLGERSLSGAVGKHMSAFYRPQDQQLLNDEILPTVLEQGQWSGELELQAAAGQTIPSIQNVFLIHNEQGQPLYVANAVTDISEQKHTAAELEARLRDLAALQRLMSREGWQSYQVTQSEDVQGYVFAHGDVQPLVAASPDSTISENGHAVKRAVEVYGEVIGTLGVVDSADRPLAPEDESFLNAIAEQVAEALERARLLEQTHKRAVELETVSQVGTAVATVHDVNELLQTMVNLTKSQFGLYHAHIYLLNNAGDMLSLVAGAGEVGQQMVQQGWQIPLSHSDSIVARAARNKQGVTANDVRQSATFLPNPLLPDTRSELAVPLLAGDTVLGVLDVQSDVVNRFTDEDIHIQTTLASQVAVALQNASLYQDTQAALAETEQQARRLNMLSQMAMALSQAGDMAAAFKVVSEKTLPIVGGTKATVALLNPDGNQLEIFELSDTEGMQPTGVYVPLAGSAAGQVVQNRRVMSFLGSKDSPQPDIRQFYQAGLVSIISAPLVSGAKVHGVISVGSRYPDSYGPREENLLLQIGTTLASIIENQRLLQETKVSLQETEILYRVSSNLAQITDQQKMFEYVLAEYLAFLQLPQGGVLIFDEAGTSGTLAALVVNGELAEPGQRIPVVGNPPCQKMIATSQPTVIVDALHDPLLDSVRDLVDDLGYKSLLLVPMIVRGQVIGALGADSTIEIHNFTPREIALVQAVADQLGGAIERQRLLVETREALAEVERTQQRYTVQSWEAYQARRNIQTYQQQREGVILAENGAAAGISQALEHKKAAVITTPLSLPGGDPTEAAPPVMAQTNLVVPLKIRNEVVGVLGLQEVANNRRWTDEEIALVEAIAEQMSLAAENLRLLDETQLRAAREKRVNEIGEKIQAAQSLEDALQIAIKEVGLSLQATETSVQLKVD